MAVTSRNLCKPAEPTTVTRNGITWTINSDGTIDVSGTATAGAGPAVGTAVLKAGTTYRLYDLPVNSRTSGSFLAITNHGSTNGNGTVTYTPTSDETVTISQWTNSGVTVNRKFTPLLQLASETDTTWTPYTESVDPSPSGSRWIELPYNETVSALTSSSYSSYSYRNNDNSSLGTAWFAWVLNERAYGPFLGNGRLYGIAATQNTVISLTQVRYPAGSTTPVTTTVPPSTRHTGKGFYYFQVIDNGYPDSTYISTATFPGGYFTNFDDAIDSLAAQLVNLSGNTQTITPDLEDPHGSPYTVYLDGDGKKTFALGQCSNSKTTAMLIQGGSQNSDLETQIFGSPAMTVATDYYGFFISDFEDTDFYQMTYLNSNLTTPIDGIHFSPGNYLTWTFVPSISKYVSRGPVYGTTTSTVGGLVPYASLADALGQVTPGGGATADQSITCVSTPNEGGTLKAYRGNSNGGISIPTVFPSNTELTADELINGGVYVGMGVQPGVSGAVYCGYPGVPGVSNQPWPFPFTGYYIYDNNDIYFCVFGLDENGGSSPNPGGIRISVGPNNVYAGSFDYPGYYPVPYIFSYLTIITTVPPGATIFPNRDAAYEAFRSNNSGQPGTTVRFVATPNSGYEYSSFGVINSVTGESVPTTAVGENEWTITMPTGAVVATITWVTSDSSPSSPGGSNPYGGLPENQPSGGGGTNNFDSDQLPNSSLPGLNISDTGMTRLYLPTISELRQLSQYLYSDSLADWWDVVKKRFEDPMQVLVGLTMLPIQIPAAGRETVKIMLTSTGVSMAYPSSNWIEIDCGYRKIEEAYGSYLDYSPYTKVSVYLPFIGEQVLNTDEVMGKTVRITYRVEITTGNCIAQISADNNYLYSYPGNMGFQIPMSSNSFDSIVNATLQVAGAVAGALVSGGAALGASAGTEIAKHSTQMRQPSARHKPFALNEWTSTETRTPAEPNTGMRLGGIAAGAVVSSADAVLSGKPSVAHSGSFNGNHGYMGVRYPFFTVEHPRLANPPDFGAFNGYPSMLEKRISECSGFLQVQQTKLINIPCLAEEYSQIMEMLKEGIIV